MQICKQHNTEIVCLKCCRLTDYVFGILVYGRIEMTDEFYIYTHNHICPTLFRHLALYAVSAFTYSRFLLPRGKKVRVGYDVTYAASLYCSPTSFSEKKNFHGGGVISKQSFQHTYFEFPMFSINIKYSLGVVGAEDFFKLSKQHFLRNKLYMVAKKIANYRMIK